jgi:hypothetical protein
MGETNFYSVRIDADRPEPNGGWFTRRDLENDLDTPAPPVLAWLSSSELEITSGTDKMSGVVVDYAGNDLKVIRRYVPSAAPTEKGD